MVACDAASDPRRATEALVAVASAVASASPEADLSFYVLANGGAADELTRRIPRILASVSYTHLTLPTILLV